MVLVCSPFVELLRKAGVPFYSALSYLSLAASWITCAIHGILLATGVDGGVSEWAFTLAAGLVGAAMLAAKDDMAKRLADIALLAAMPAEADRIEQLLPPAEPAHRAHCLWRQRQGGCRAGAAGAGWYGPHVPPPRQAHVPVGTAGLAPGAVGGCACWLQHSCSQQQRQQQPELACLLVLLCLTVRSSPFPSIYL
jgi:hypothetical protein